MKRRAVVLWGSARGIQLGSREDWTLEYLARADARARRAAFVLTHGVRAGLVAEEFARSMAAIEKAATVSTKDLAERFAAVERKLNA